MAASKIRKSALVALLVSALGFFAPCALAQSTDPAAAEILFAAGRCSDDPLYPSIKRFVCISADTPLTDESAACDGASFAIAFQTAGVTLGVEAPIIAPPTECTPETVPRGDTCAMAPEG